MKTDDKIMELESVIYIFKQINAILNKKHEKFSRLLLPLFTTSLFTTMLANLSISAQF